MRPATKKGYSDSVRSAVKGEEVLGMCLQERAGILYNRRTGFLPLRTHAPALELLKLRKGRDDGSLLPDRCPGPSDLSAERGLSGRVTKVPQSDPTRS